MDIIATEVELKKWCLALICLIVLPLTIVSQDESGIITASLDIPLPRKDLSEQILRRKGYVVSYNADLRIPNWVAWHLTAEHVKWITGTVPLITSHSPCTTAEDGRCQSLAISDSARGRKMK